MEFNHILTIRIFRDRSTDRIYDFFLKLFTLREIFLDNPRSSNTKQRDEIHSVDVSGVPSEDALLSRVSSVTSSHGEWGWSLYKRYRAQAISI